MKFSHTIATTASRQAIWRLWTDVSTWAEWDTELKSAYLNGNFALGSKGTLVPKTGVKSAFEITEYHPGESYAFTIPLFLSQLTIRRSFSDREGLTKFTHEIRFSGFLGGLFGFLLGRKFKRVLPSVMENLRLQAECEL
ncbi:polyketide cyclase [Leptolyngbya sp. 'hensonii']|uniref:SRPBCC family protein n=1 Tax=Leptolyngbya sp. 'hensonii' TaxID=1922337 RepID=UPI00094FCCFC|nr:SRPBCC family protein [Leptolyngbya sp. 'hensonii']OLP18133.1 polyketide cyclase [Leptolyngbya sp. 'hensonii']